MNIKGKIKLNRIVKKICSFSSILNFIYQYIDLTSNIGYLRQTGWVNSVRKNKAINKHGEPIPWFTYPAIDFITTRLKKEMLIFEYGSGNSTLFFAKNVKHVFSVEHEQKWFNLMKTKLPENVTYYFHNLINKNNYVDSICDSQKKFDIVVIDGRKRVECAEKAVKKLKSDGIIIWDNSLRDRYKYGLKYLEEKGFKRIDFTGLDPIVVYKSVTSVFYKQNNVFNI